MAIIEVLDPTATPETISISALKTDSLEGQRIGILNNGWQSWATTISQLEQDALNSHGAASVHQWPIPVSSAAPDEMLDKVGQTTDLVLVGLAN